MRVIAQIKTVMAGIRINDRLNQKDRVSINLVSGDRIGWEGDSKEVDIRNGQDILLNIYRLWCPFHHQNEEIDTWVNWLHGLILAMVNVG